MRALVFLAALAFPVSATAQNGPPPPPIGHSDAPTGPNAPSDHPGGGRVRLFISPMGEPFRGPDPIGAWFAGADRNHDGVVTEAEFIADADRFFVILDRGHDGEIDPDDIEYYETELAPEIRTDGGGGGGGGGSHGGGGHKGGGHHGGHGGGEGGGMGGGHGGGDGDEENAGDTPSAPTIAYDDVARGAARFGFFDYPEPVTAADANLNRGVDVTEFRNAAAARFAMLDKKGDGKLTREELPTLFSSAPGHGGKSGWHGGHHRPGGMDGNPSARPSSGD
jgi:hypothetical protein